MIAFVCGIVLLSIYYPFESCLYVKVSPVDSPVVVLHVYKIELNFYVVSSYFFFVWFFGPVRCSFSLLRFATKCFFFLFFFFWCSWWSLVNMCEQTIFNIELYEGYRPMLPYLLQMVENLKFFKMARNFYYRVLVVVVLFLYFYFCFCAILLWLNLSRLVVFHRFDHRIIIWVWSFRLVASLTRKRNCTWKESNHLVKSNEIVWQFIFNKKI